MEAAGMEKSERFRDRSVTANGIRLHVIEGTETEKPPLLLLHGIYDRAEGWQPVAEALSQRFRLIIPDLRGHYQSEWPTDGYQLRDYAADAIGLLEALGIENASVLGHSLGALIAMEAASASPTRVRMLILEDPPSEMDDQTRTWLGALLSAKHFTPQQTYVALHGMYPESSEDDLRRQTEWLRATADGPFLALDADVALSAGGFSVAMERVSQSVLLLQADPRRGGALSAAAARHAVATHGSCRLVTFHDTGHTIHRERPVEFVTAVSEFLVEQ
jgi:pimeloyl-ACP methyl ester carboxylesterase